jgi:hypothetical protein
MQDVPQRRSLQPGDSTTLSAAMILYLKQRLDLPLEQQRTARDTLKRHLAQS